jgi:hypothetical protein
MLIVANISFAIIPLFIGELRTTSTFTLAFLRFLGAGIVELIIFCGVAYHLNQRLKIHDPSLKSKVFFKRIIGRYYFSSNPHFFHGKPQWLYLVFMGFILINLSIPAYFLSFSLNGLVISTISVNGCTLIIIAILNWVKKEEQIDLLRIVDITLLFAAIFTIAFSRNNLEVVPISIEGFLCLLITIGSYSLFIIGIGSDVSGKIMVTGFNLTLLPQGKQLEQYALLMKAMLKLATMHFAGVLLMLPFTFIITIISPSSVFGEIAHQFLFIDLRNLGVILINPSIFALILIGSILPYFLIVYSGIIWPRHGLTHDGWNSILTLLDPLIGMYIGYLIWLEPLRSDYILFTTIFLLSGLIIRYFHGAANVRRFLFVIKLKPNHSQLFLKYIQNIKEIIQVSQTLGTYHFLLRISVQNIARLEQIANQINLYPGLEKATYSVETNHL